MSLRSKVIRLAHEHPEFRKELLPLVAATQPKVEMSISPKFYIDKDLRKAERVSFMFSFSGTERQGLEYVNANLSGPLDQDLRDHLNEQWERYVHRMEYEDEYVGPEDSTFLRGSLLRDALRAAQVVGKRAGATEVMLRGIARPTR